MYCTTFDIPVAILLDHLIEITLSCRRTLEKTGIWIKVLYCIKLRRLIITHRRHCRSCLEKEVCITQVALSCFERLDQSGGKGSALWHVSGQLGALTGREDHVP